MVEARLWVGKFFLCQKERSSLKKVCLTAFAESEFGIGLANSDLPKRTQFFKKNIPEGICRIGIRQPRHFRYRLLFGNEINRKRWVDQEVNLPEERRPRRSMETRVFRYRMHNW